MYASISKYVYVWIYKHIMCAYVKPFAKGKNCICIYKRAYVHVSMHECILAHVFFLSILLY